MRGSAQDRTARSRTDRIDEILQRRGSAGVGQHDPSGRHAGVLRVRVGPTIARATPAAQRRSMPSQSAVNSVIRRPRHDCRSIRVRSGNSSRVPPRFDRLGKRRAARPAGLRGRALIVVRRCHLLHESGRPTGNARRRPRHSRRLKPQPAARHHSRLSQCASTHGVHFGQTGHFVARVPSALPNATTTSARARPRHDPAGRPRSLVVERVHPVLPMCSVKVTICAAVGGVGDDSVAVIPSERRLADPGNRFAQEAVALRHKPRRTAIVSKG